MTFGVFVCRRSRGQSCCAEHVVEQGGQRLERGWLLPDDSMFRKSQVAMTSVDPEGSPTEPPEIHSAGQKLELRAMLNQV